MSRMKVAVLGAGNWGSTLSHLAGINGHDVHLWSRDPEQVEEINTSHTNRRAVPELELSKNVQATTKLKHAIADASLVLMVIPSQAFRQVCRAAGEVLLPDQVVIHATKGLERDTHRRMSQLISEETCVRQIGVLSGPNIAGEIALGQPAGTVIASHFPRVIEVGRTVIASRQMMVFSGDDVLGVELAGALKNVVALAAGMASAMALGENVKALIVTRGLAEITRLGTALGAEALSFGGLAGFGDLMVTCNSSRSRNHRVGEALGRGEKLSEILERLGQVAEGVQTTLAAHQLAKRHGIAAPLVERVYRVLYEDLPVASALAELMQERSGRDVGHLK